MEFYKVHCPRCGRIMTAEDLAFDFGEVINIALEKAKNRIFGANDEWYMLTRVNLCLYLSLQDLQSEYGFQKTERGFYEGQFEFTAQRLANQILKLANSMNPNMSIEIIAREANLVEYANLTNYMGKNAGEDPREIAEKIQDIAVRIQKNPNSVIAKFRVKVSMQEDDRRNQFARHVEVQFDDGDIKNITRFVCKGRENKPCGKILYGHAGRYKEIIIGLAGTARVGKTAYLAALLSCIMRKGNGAESLGHEQEILINIAYADEDYEKFEEDLLNPYIYGRKITKTSRIVDKTSEHAEAIPLFSLTFGIKDPETGEYKKYIFTFIDMPGEVFDDGTEGADFIAQNRPIIQSASMIWFCISPSQIKEVDSSMAGISERENTKLKTVFKNLNSTLTAINVAGNIPTAVLITKSDMIKMMYENFNPFENKQTVLPEIRQHDETSPWVGENGYLYFDNMKWFLEKSLQQLKSGGAALPLTIKDTFGKFSPFAIAAYGRSVDKEDNIFMSTSQEDQLPTPSMIEAPFLWTLAVLGLIPVYKETLKTRIVGFLLFKKEERYWEYEEVKDIDELFYYN